MKLDDDREKWFWNNNGFYLEFSSFSSSKLENFYQIYLKNEKEEKILLYESDGIHQIDFREMTKTDQNKDKYKIIRNENSKMNLDDYPKILGEESICIWCYENEKEEMILFQTSSQKVINEKFQKKKKIIKVEEENMSINFSKMISTDSSNNNFKIHRFNSKAIWCYFDGKKWKRYNQKFCSQIEDAYIKKKPKIEMKIKLGWSKSLCELNLQSFVQTDLKTMQKYKVMRVSPKIAKPIEMNHSIIEMNKEEIEEIKKNNKRRYLCHVKEMLWTAKRNYKMIDPPKFINDKSEKSKSLKREDFKLEENNVFTLENVLSPQICEYYIEKSNESGFENLENQFEKEYRSSEMILLLDQVLSNLIWENIKTSLKDEDIIFLKPMGFNQEGTWKATQLNKCLKISKYKEGQKKKS